MNEFDLNTRRSSPFESWTAADIPPQAGRLAVVTGATGDLGFATAMALARAGADVILAGENESDGRAALSMIRPRAPMALVRFERFDSSSMASVAELAGRLNLSEPSIDLLVNVGDGAVVGRRQLTQDGFERSFGLNYLAPFALTARLLPLLRKGRRPRVVHQGGVSHLRGSIRFDDLQFERGYDSFKAYAHARLATLIFSRELQRRSTAKQWGLLSVAADTDSMPLGFTSNGENVGGLLHRLRGVIGLMPGQAAANSVKSLLMVATAPNVRRGGYYGPTGPLEFAGPHGLQEDSVAVDNKELAERLWAVSEQLTGVTWPSE